MAAAAAAAKSLQSCLTLCDLIDGSPSGSPVPGILQARTLQWVAISFSNAGKWKVKVKSLSRVRLLATPWTASHQAPPSMGFSRQEYWHGVPLPSLENGREHVNGCVVFCGVTIPRCIHYPFNGYSLCFPFLPLWTILNKSFMYILQFSSVAQSCPTLCDPMDCSTPGLPVHHQLLEFTQTHVHQVGDPFQPSHPLSSPSPLLSVFPSIRVFSNESALCIRWPKY